ncbi:uncharacterized protein LOC143920599 [Arctopsyche grandis]|uniref:uncharacterized protein LOC143920599 n=1 Tax=Arctopsyche grandis TaxID=121162 RepID=UPI00406D9334
MNISADQLKQILNKFNGVRDLASCESRYDGVKDCNQVNVFISQVERFKNQEGLSDREALISFPMLLTGTAANWWNADDSETWEEAMVRFKRYFAPAYCVYQEIINIKQKPNECTVIFLMQKRSLFKCLPPPELPESVQLDMMYGQLRSDIRNFVPREDLESFQDLISNVMDNNEQFKNLKITPKETSEVKVSMVTISVGGVNEIAVLGSAAQVCLASSKLYQVLTKQGHQFTKEKHMVSIFGNSSERETLWTDAMINLSGRVISNRFLILPKCDIKNTILGLDFFAKVIVRIDSWSFNDDPSKVYEYHREKDTSKEKIRLIRFKISPIVETDNKSPEKKSAGKKKAKRRRKPKQDKDQPLVKY